MDKNKEFPLDCVKNGLSFINLKHGKINFRCDENQLNSEICNTLQQMLNCQYLKKYENQIPMFEKMCSWPSEKDIPAVKSVLVNQLSENNKYFNTLYATAYLEYRLDEAKKNY